MKPLARVGDPVSGGLHCHGHDHGLLPSPGTIGSGSSKVFADRMPAARGGDSGGWGACCGGVATIQLLPQPGKVFIEGRPAVPLGNPTLHCGMGSGQVTGGSSKVSV